MTYRISDGAQADERSNSVPVVELTYPKQEFVGQAGPAARVSFVRSTLMLQS